MVFRMGLTYSEVDKVVDTKYFAKLTISFTLPASVYEIIDINWFLKTLLPNEVKLNIKIDDIRLRSNLTTNKIMRFTEKSFFYTILGFTQSHSGPLDDIERLLKYYWAPIRAMNPVKLQASIRFF